MVDTVGWLTIEFTKLHPTKMLKHYILHINMVLYIFCIRILYIYVWFYLFVDDYMTIPIEFTT
jgi:hypothetical protein